MPDEVLKSIAEDITRVDEQITRATDLISAMKEAGEDTATLEADLRTQIARKNRWERMLTARGVTVSS